jgi:hypothetical protein
MTKHLCAQKEAILYVAAVTVCCLAFAASYGTTQAACTLGEEACPVLLRMQPGATAINATGSVSAERPDYYFKFYAKAGQTMFIQTAGGGLKTGPGIPITGPNGEGSVFENQAYTLPATGAYMIDLHANLMSEGTFGQFTMTLKIQNSPVRVGECANTTIKWVGTRLGAPGSGSSVVYQNGLSQVDYDTVPAIDQSRKGDPVHICLVFIPINCPKGDNRGRKYRTTNLRTHQTWTLYDSEHLCGGA